MRRFSQVDVFASSPLSGNPLAVVHDAEGLDDEQLGRFANWTNLSETTFLLAPTTDDADYRVRILTPDRELPFAGHPTLGSAHAWLEAGHQPRTPGRLVQECAAGLIELRQAEGRWAFAAPALIKDGPVDHTTRARIVRALRIRDTDIVDLAWADNGPGWMAVLLEDAEAVLAIEPDPVELAGLDVGVVGPWPEGSETAIEVRALYVDAGVREDPVTGSLNAAVGQWLTGNGTLPASYVASQGARLGRAGRIHIDRVGDTVWVGGATQTVVSGEFTL